MLVRHDGGDAGRGQLRQRVERCGQAAAVQPNAFRRAPACGVAFAGRAGQNGFGVAQGTETRLSQCGGGIKFFLRVQRQFVQDGLEPFQGGFVRFADFGQFGRNPAVQAAQALQVEGAARFGAGAGQAVSAERLYAHDRANDVAVHIYVARFDAVTDVVYGFIDTAVDTVGQGVAFAVDLVDQAVEFAGAVTDHVQHGTEHFAFQFGQVVQFEQNRADKGGVLRIDVGSQFDFMEGLGGRFHSFDMCK